MRPLDPQDRDAPVSALIDPQGFWDHLGTTRAEEYAQGDIVPVAVVPVPRDPAPDAPELADRASAAFTRDDLYLGRLDDTLQAVDMQQAASGAEATGADSPAFAPTAERTVEAAAMTPIPDASFAMAADPSHRSWRLSRARRSRIADGRLSYRLQRIWLTPLYRAVLKYGIPAVAAIAMISSYFANEANRQHLISVYDTVYSAFVDRPEFLVTSLRWPDVAPELDAALRERLDMGLPKSSFRLDLDDLRREVEALDWVRSADLRLMSDGALALSLVERVPAILWRSSDGLELLDDEGIRVARVASRSVRGDLPLMAGAGASDHIREALDLLDAASSLGDRVQGLVRVGERRWDVVLDRDQRIRLPEKGALSALERVIALEQAQDLLSRDLLVADLRNPSRPVMQISAGAKEILSEIRSSALESRQ